MGNCILWSEIGWGFSVPGGTPPPKNIMSTPRGWNLQQIIYVGSWAATTGISKEYDEASSTENNKTRDLFHILLSDTTIQTQTSFSQHNASSWAHKCQNKQSRTPQKPAATLRTWTTTQLVQHTLGHRGPGSECTLCPSSICQHFLQSFSS